MPTDPPSTCYEISITSSVFNMSNTNGHFIIFSFVYMEILGANIGKYNYVSIDDI